MAGTAIKSKNNTQKTVSNFLKLSSPLIDPRQRGRAGNENNTEAGAGIPLMSAIEVMVRYGVHCMIG
jgi:hypothetical protein